MKNNKELISEIIKDIKHDMTDEEILALLAGSKISVNPVKERKEKVSFGQRTSIYPTKRFLVCNTLPVVCRRQCGFHFVSFCCSALSTEISSPPSICFNITSCRARMRFTFLYKSSISISVLRLTL